MSTEKISVNDWMKSLVEKESKKDPPAMEGAEEAVDEIIRNIRKARFHYANEERRTQMEIDLVTDQIAAEKKNYESIVERNRQLEETSAELKRKDEELERNDIAPTLAQLRKEFFSKNVPLTAQLKQFAQTQFSQAEINAMCDEAGVAICVSSSTYKLFMRDDPSIPAIEVKMQENFEDTKDLINEAILALKSKEEACDSTETTDNTAEQSAVTEAPSLVPYTDSSMTDSDC